MMSEEKTKKSTDSKAKKTTKTPKEKKVVEKVTEVEETITEETTQAESTVEETVEDVSAEAADAEEVVEAEAADAEEAAEEAVEDSADVAEEQAEEAVEDASTEAADAEETVEDSADAAEEVAEEAVEDVQTEASEAEKTVEDSVDAAEDAAEEAVEDASTEASDAEETVEDSADAAEEAAEDASAEVADAKEGNLAKAVASSSKAPNNKNRNVAFVVIIVVAVLLVVLLLVLTNKNDGVGVNAVAKVGNAIITQEMVDHEAALIIFNNYGQSLDSLTPEEQRIYKNQILVYFLVQAETIKEYLREQGLAEFNEEQKAAISDNINAYYASIENAEEVLKTMGITRADVQYFAEINEYMGIYQEKVIADNPVTDADVEQFYNENKTYFVTPAQVSASHILITDPDHTPEKRAEMEAILLRAKEGEDFAELAKEFSEDPGSASTGGDVGYFGEDHGFVPEFGAAALALKNVGDISDIVETNYGYHIIKLTDKQAETQEPLDVVSSEIMYYLVSMRVDETAASLLESYEVTYYVDVDPETGLPQLVLPAAEEEVAGVDVIPETTAQ